MYRTSKDAFTQTNGGKTKSNAIEIPNISLPKGGGAIKGIDEKFSVNAVNGTSSVSIPLPFSRSRGLTPSLSINYNSGAGNGVFGLGWSMDLPSIKRNTDKRLPQYFDSDTFLFSGAEELVPEFDRAANGSFITDAHGNYVIKEKNSPDNLYTIRFFKPRIEGLFARIELWAKRDNTETKWRVITKENVTTLFGWSSNSRLADPRAPYKIFEWLPEFSFDDKGNCSRYIYKHEDKKGVDLSQAHNRNRFVDNDIAYTNLYLDKLLYGNKTPYKKFGDAYPANNDFLFETVCDYGTLGAGDEPDTLNEWDFRPDAFSMYQSGFEIRTTRLCKRVLLFHHFTGAGEYDGLVRSINFDYDTTVEQDFTFLRSITSCGYIKRSDGSYARESLPAVEFHYQKHAWNKTVKTIQLPHAPAGIEEYPYQFVDLFNEGLPGILTEQAGGWYYMHNLGKGNFEQAKLIRSKPSFSGLGTTLTLLDLDNDGTKQLTSYSTEPKGFFELDDDGLWQPFRHFEHMPVIDFDNAYTRMIDLNGDGRPELLTTGDYQFSWYENDGRKGFKRGGASPNSLDEEKGPSLVFADPKQTIFLADMSGDGLVDIVRITSSHVCYWPNLGYGKFGAKVQMDNAPVFDSDHDFNPAYIRLADIDGSGTADIIYLGKNNFSCWKNLSGNRFSATPFVIEGFPEVHSFAKINITDLLGNGVACIVWSSPMPKDTLAPLKYIDLMDSKKPHVMTSYRNNLGKEVMFEYSASTRYYIEDKLAGRPWKTKLHFPVQCVSRAITIDKITGHQYSASYQYHHGYYDHLEREFRGFGMVEQIEGETFEHWAKSGASNITDETFHQEPVITRQWFHTGASLRNGKILFQFEEEYWYEEMKRQGYSVTHQEKKLDDAVIIPGKGIATSLMTGLSAEEYQQALRACKGMAIRSEVFARDAVKFAYSPDAVKKELVPFSVGTKTALIELIQPKGKNDHAIFLVKESESLTYEYDRNIEDPRTSHILNTGFDEYGNILESASVVYPRKIADAALPADTQAVQDVLYIKYALARYTKDAFDDHNNRQRLPAEGMTFQLKGVSKTGDFYTVKDFEDILSDTKSDSAAYHEIDKPPATGKAQRRLIEHTKTFYYKNDLTSALPLYDLESRGINCESLQLAYTPELITDVFNGKVSPALMLAAKFVHSKDELNNDDANWWIPSGRIQYIQGAETVADAQNRFFVPVSYTDPLGAKTRVKYYSTYFLMVEETEDELANKGSVLSFNFRTLTPARMKDVNDNITSVINNELGLIKAMAVQGKGDQADDLVGITEETDAAEAILIQNYLGAPSVLQDITDSAALISTAALLLKNATARYVYDFSAYALAGKPAVASTIVRETHVKNELGELNPASKIQLSFEYSSGFGNVAMKKVQAEPGIAKRVKVLSDDTIQVDEIDTTPFLRWLGSGKQVINNKGNIVKEYLPYFSVNNRYEDDKELVETGITSINYYDAMSRLIRTDMPDGSFSKVVFSSWKQLIFDQNDTIIESDWYKKRTDNTRPDFIQDAKQQAAASKTALHANTPAQLHFDTLGRPVLSIEHNKHLVTNADEYYYTRSLLDIEGNLRSVTDHRDNEVMAYKYDMLGNKVYQLSMDAGERFLFQDIIGNPFRHWDNRNHEFSFEYDILHRPIIKSVKGGDGPVALDHVYEKIIYGEGLPDSKANNLRLKAVIIYDTAGKIETPLFDFKGSALQTTRTFATNYKDVVDWSGPNPDARLDTESFTSLFEFDALGRITKQVAPDAPLDSTFLPVYNQTGLLEQVQVKQGAQTQWFVRNIDYNEKLQRSRITYGNQVTINYTYDEETLRLIQVETKKQNNDPLQDLHYTYDPVGNLTHLQDKNIPLIFFNNAKTDGTAEYTYDALYRLREASGREHAGQLNFGIEDTWNDLPFMKQYSPSDSFAWRPYTQKYDYDEVGNIRQMKHTAPGGSWTRDYEYEASNNRLKKTVVGAGADTFQYNAYTHHLQHGFITALPHLQLMNWNFKDQLQAVARQSVVNGTPETTYYVYDSNGQRARKVTEVQAGAGIINPARKNQRFYVGGIEVYREYDHNDTMGLQRLTYHVMDDQQRIALIETRIDGDDGSPPRLVRYQFQNHLSSATMETDDSVDAEVISYEEYHPFGTTAYQANNKDIKAAAKRFRYTGMERDEESGLEYHSARYYLPWLGRWLSADPIGLKGGLNLYAYSEGRVMIMNDKNGKEPGTVLSLGRATLPSETVTNGVIKGMQFNVTESNATRAAEVAGRPATMTVRGMTGFRDVFNMYNSEPRASAALVETALKGKGVVSGAGIPISAVHINSAGVEVGAAAEKAYHTSAELGIIKRTVEAGKHTVGVFVEGEAGLQVFAPGSKAISISSTVDLLAHTPVRSFAGARPIATALAPLRPLATATIAAAGKLAPVAAKLEPVVTKLAPVAAKLAPAAKVLGKVAGPLGIGVGVAQMATAKTTAGKVDGGITTVSSALMMSKHPVAMAAGAGLMTGQVIEKTLDVSKYASDHGMAVYEGLKSSGVNDTVSFVAGGVVTVVSTPVAIVEAAADKTFNAAKSLYRWISD